MSHKNEVQIKKNILLKPLTTLKIGGSARYFCEVKNEKELLDALSFSRRRKIPYFILGGGSNIVISDSGFPGIVIQNRIQGIEIIKKGKKAEIRVGAGENWDRLVERCVNQNLAGMELLSAIPGTVGAAPVQNIGAYGQSADKIIKSVTAFDSYSNKTVMFSNSDCKFKYRNSLFKSSKKNRYVIIEVSFKLILNGKPNLSAYHEIEKYFKNYKKMPKIADVRKAVIEIRSKKGMVIDSEVQSYKSVGSFFINPTIPKEDFTQIRRKLTETSDSKWFFELSREYKISAAFLIEQSGFPKAYREGEVGVSPKHALSLINYGNANAADMIALARKIKSAVFKKFGIILESEAQFVGFDSYPL